MSLESVVGYTYIAIIYVRKRRKKKIEIKLSGEVNNIIPITGRG